MDPQPFDTTPDPLSIAGIMLNPAMREPVLTTLNQLQHTAAAQAAAAGVSECHIILCVWITLTRLLLSWGGNPDAMAAALVHAVDTTRTDDEPMPAPGTDQVQ